MSHREPRRQHANLRAALLTGGSAGVVGGEGGRVRGLGGEDDNLDIHLDGGRGLGTTTHQAALSRATHEDMLICASRAKPMPVARTDEVIYDQTLAVWNGLAAHRQGSSWSHSLMDPFS